MDVVRERRPRFLLINNKLERGGKERRRSIIRADARESSVVGEMTLRLYYRIGIVVSALVYVARVRVFSVNFESIFERFFVSGRSFTNFLKIRKCEEIRSQEGSMRRGG